MGKQVYSERLSVFRQSLGLNQTQFAKRLDTPRTTIIGYETGNSIPSDFLIKLHRTFKINLQWFLLGKGSPLDISDYIPEEPIEPEDNEQETLPIIIANEMQGSKETSLISEIKSNLEDLAREATAPQFAEHEKELQSIKERLIKLENRSLHTEELDDPFPIYNDSEEDEEEETTRLPLAENLAAGIPIEAFDTGESRAVPSKYLKQGRRYCVAVIKGTSMVDAGIPDGVDVLLEYADKPVDGAIMVVTHEGHTTLKRLHETKSGWELLYEDGSRAKIELTPGQWEVKGAFVRVL